MKAKNILFNVSAVFALSSVAFISSTFAQASGAQGGRPANMGMAAPEKPAAFQADVERVLAPRGEKIGLLLATHGAGSPRWTQVTESLRDQVRALDAKEKRFAAIEVCDMEFNFKNDIAEGFKRLEAAGCDAVVVEPVFIYPTSHVQFDLPTALGVYGEKSAREGAREEGMRVLKTKLPISLAATLSSGNLLRDYVVSEAKRFSKTPADERLLVIAHGDEDYRGLVEKQTKSALDAAAELGFDSVGCAFCEMGQTFATEVKPVIEKNTQEGKKTVVVAIYLSSSAKSFIEGLEKRAKAMNMGEGASPSLEGLDYVLSDKALGDFDGTAQHVYEAAIEASLN